MNLPNEPSIFRQSALKRFTSPEPLDQLLSIVAVRLRPLLARVWQWRHLRGTRSSGSRVRVKTPTILQMEAVECGAAALAIILGFHRRIVPLEELRVQCGVSRDGSKASNLVRAARRYGLLAKGFKKEPSELVDLPMPVIVFWNFTHFLVVEGFGRGRVYLNDPATGPRTVSAQEFDESYTGVALAFAPGTNFEPGGVRRSLVTALRGRLRGFEPLLLGVLAVSSLLILPGLASPIITRDFVDRVLVHHALRWVTPLLIGLGVTVVTRGLLTWLQGIMLLLMQTRLSAVTSCQFFAHTLRLPIEFYSQRYAGDISARVSINDRVASLLSGDLAVNTLGALFIVFYAVLMVRYNFILASVSILVALLNIVVLRVIARRRADANRRLGQDRGKLVGAGYAALQMIETVKASGAESDFFARWAGFQARVVNAGQALAVPTLALGLAPVLLASLNTSAVLVLGAALILNGHLSIGTLVAFQALALGFLGPIDQLVRLGSTVQEIDGDMSRLDDVLSYPVDPQVNWSEESEPSAATRLSGDIELRNLTFGYNRSEPPLIDNLDLHLRPGSRVALVGGSGSGKSTVARLICGLYEPWSGQVLLDGQSRTDLPRSVITGSLALVDQDINLFAGTVLDNITLWDPNITLDDAMFAARDAEIHGEIMARPDQYHSCLDERGRDLSGGQRQRLEIARALVRNPTILVMDEATSALDPVTEEIVMANIRHRGCTCVIVAHRLSTIRDADEILVFDAGKVVQRGTHRELQGMPGLYSRLIHAEDPDIEDESSVQPHNGFVSEVRSPSPQVRANEDMLAACKLVGRAAGITIRAHPYQSEGNDLDAIARASRLHTREVLLQGQWWELDNGPLLGFTKLDGAPVALVPTRSGAYTLVNATTGIHNKVTGTVASSLLSHAVMFYRPLPEGPIDWRDLVRFGLFGAKRDLITVALAGSIGGLIALIIPLATGLIFNSVIPHDRTGELAQLGLALVVGAFAIAAFGILQRIALLRVESRADASIQAAVWDRLISLPSWFFREYEAGDLGDRAMGISAIHQMLSENVVASFLAALFALSSLALLFAYDARMALVAVGLVAVFAAVTAAIARWELGRRRVEIQLQGRLSGLVLQILMGIARLRVAGAEGRVLQRWAASFDAKTRAAYRAGVPRLALSTWSAMFPVVGTLVLFELVSYGGTIHLKTGTFLAFVAAFAQFIAAAMAFNAALTSVIEVVPMYERVAPILQTSPEVAENGTHPGELRGEVRLDHVSFRYGEGPIILDDVSLFVRPGESVAIVGPSGSGKSTLLRLLLGFERPEVGTVSFDGQDLETLDIREVRRQLGVVLQNGSVTPGFILDNILGAASLTVDDAWEAANKAGLSEDIQRLPMGMYTLVSEGGTTFSGGQRQRLLIARALARRPRLLFFDEATSALDNATQAVVAGSLEQLQATRIVIAHRLSTVMQADRIIVMEAGRIRQVGTYRELMREEGVFKRLAERQIV